MSNNKWLFKKEISDMSVFEKYEKCYGVAIPSELMKFIVENNASNPCNNLVVINQVERVFDVVLSFNEDDTNETMFKDIYNCIENKSVIPFALDPFGNVFCYRVMDGNIIFYNHEEDEYIDSYMNLQTFLDSMYA